MDEPNEYVRLKELIAKAKDILIVTHAQPTYDSMGSALSLYIGLKTLGKNVVVGCPDPMTVEFSNFVGANKVQSVFSKKNFVISLDYEDGSIEKVSYNIEGNKFNLIIEPRPGFENFSKDNVIYSHKGTSADIIFSIDTMHLGELGSLYEGEKELFATSPIVNIDKHEGNAKYGTVNIVGDAATTAELVAVTLSELGVELTEDIATNLINALYKGTHSFQDEVTSRTFEVAAVCVKAGAKRFPEASESSTQSPTEVVTEVKKEEIAPQSPTSTEHQSTGLNPPEDWLKPKIFKSSTLM